MSTRASIRVPILMYHRVVSNPFDPSVDCYRLMHIAVSQARFDQQMRWVSANYAVIPLRDLVEFLHEKRSIPDNACVITFDDSYKDHYRYALPVLKKYNLTATFFIESGHTAEGNRLRFVDRYYYSIDHSPLKEFSFALPNRIEYRSYPLNRLTKWTLARDASLKQWLKQSDLATQDKILKDWENALVVRIDREAVARDLYLSQKEMREMLAAGMELGAHTINHPALSQLDLATARQEIFESGDFVRGISQASSVAFSYPFGDGCAVPAIANFVKEYGYYAACTDGADLNDASTDPFDLNRLGIEQDTFV